MLYTYQLNGHSTEGPTTKSSGVNDAGSRRGGDRASVGGGYRALIGVTAAVAIVAVIGWGAATGRLAGLQYTNVPLVHPYPPEGYFVNPFTGDRRDLVSSSEAARVRSDFVDDGRMEVDAFARGDGSLLARAETGRALAAARDLIATNAARGVSERADNHVESIVVGRLADPNDASISWVVRETGTATISFVSRTTGVVTQTQRVRFDSRYWMVRSGDRYLIADVDISTQPIAGKEQ